MLKMYVRAIGAVDKMSLPDYIRTGAGMSFGGYCFDIPINGKIHRVNFDFPGDGVSIQEDGTVILEAGAETMFGKNDCLDDCYDEEYNAQGISRADLTASTLASAKKIEDFKIDCDGEIDFQILSIMFVDDMGTYKVSRDVIDAYNQLQKTMKLVARADALAREIPSSEAIEIDEYEGEIWISKYSEPRGSAECIERFCNKNEINMEKLKHECNLNNWCFVL